jgi:dCTP deaminase
MVINGVSLVFRTPIKDMAGTKIYEKGVSYGLGEAGYDIRIKQEINFTRDFFLRRCVERVEFSSDPFRDHKTLREPGNFVIASAMEEFTMPSDMVGIVHDKSSWARRGLSVFNTVIESGWRGFLTLELVYHGSKDLHIPAGSGIAQVVFHQVSNPAQYRGRYQDQANEPVPAIVAEPALL